MPEIWLEISAELKDRMDRVGLKPEDVQAILVDQLDARVAVFEYMKSSKALRDPFEQIGTFDGQNFG